MSLPAPQHASENVVRGALLALIVIPVGVTLWVVIWSIGVIASIVAFGVAYGAVWLYRKGSGGFLTRPGAFVVLGVVVVTLLLSFYAGLVYDFVRTLSDASGVSQWDAFNAPTFWASFNAVFPALVKAEGVSFLLAIAFSVLGCYRILMRSFAISRAPSATTSQYGSAPLGYSVEAPLPESSAPERPEPPTQQLPSLNPESSGTISSAPDDKTPPATPRD